MAPEDAYELLESIAIISVTKDKLKLAKEPSDDTQEQTIKRPPIDFYKCGLKDGDSLVCKDDPSIVVTIKGNRKVLYNDELTSLSAIMAAKKGRKAIAGPSYFTLNGEPLVDIAERTQWKNK